jgi:protein-S-isoprenylcysteine O-methyltransferase Ste14
MTSALQGDQPKGINRSRLVLLCLASLALLVLFLFLPAGTWAWSRGWLFVLVFVAVSTMALLVLWRVNPEVIIARSYIHKGTKGWDKVLLRFLFPAMIAIFPVAALDDGRFHWFPVRWWVCLVGYSLLLIGIAITIWAEAVNKFFEPTVRIQAERGHKVIDTGPTPSYVIRVTLAVRSRL